MFDLGFQELIVIFIVALLVFGPKRLPELARNLGKGVGQLRKAMFDLKSEVEREMEDTEGKIKHDLPSWKDVSPYDPYQKTEGKTVKGDGEDAAAEGPSVNVPPAEPQDGTSLAGEERRPPEERAAEEPSGNSAQSSPEDRHESGA